MARTTINSLGIPADTIVSADLDYPLTDFSSTGIDDNASSTSLTIDSSGNISVTGTVDGRDLATDGSKLDGIAASATNYGDSDVATYISGNRSYGNITTTGYIAGPSTFTIDPAAVGDNTGTLVIAGNLQVDGTTTTINSTTMTVDDLNITLASGAANAAAANGAGITVDGASATLTYNSTSDAWSFNKNVGIGTTSPNAALDVNGGTSAGSYFYGGTNNRRQLIIKSFDTTSLDAGHDFDASSINGVLTFSTYSTERMRIDSSGEVGIGISNPQRTLHINGGATRTDVQLTLDGYGETNADGVQFGILTTGSYIWNFENTDLYFGTNNIRRLTIAPDGKVGIGTESPALKLDVNAGTDNVGIVTRSTDAGAYISFVDNTTTNESTVYIGADGNDLVQFAGSAECMRINTDGQVLINRQTSISGGTGSKLCISGNVDIDGNPGATNVIRLHQSATEMGQLYAHTTGVRSYLFSGNAFSIKGQSNAILKLVPGGGAYNASLQWLGNTDQIATEGFEIWYDNDVGDVHLNTTYNHDNAAIRFHTKTAAGQSEVNERFTIAGNGNIGINEPTPFAKFTIDNNGGTNHTFYADVGNLNDTQTLFAHTGASTPVPFRISKSGYTGNSQGFGIIHFHMNHSTAGGGSNLHFTLLDSDSNITEYGGIGAQIVDSTNGSEDGRLNFWVTQNSNTRQNKMYLTQNGALVLDGSTAGEYVLDVDGNSFQGRMARLPGRFIIGPNGNSYPEIGYNFIQTTGNSTNTKQAGDTSYKINFGTGGKFTFSSSGSASAGSNISWTDVMTITNGAFVGIGSNATSPISPLTVHAQQNNYGPITARTGNYTTQWSILPWSVGNTYISSGIYYAGSNWVHASPGTYNCLFDIGGSGGIRWYASDNSTSSWNLASNVQLFNNAGQLTASSASDERLKENIVDYTIADALTKVNALRPVSFEWNDTIKRKKGTEYADGRHVGFIAQEVETVFPEACLVSDTDQYDAESAFDLDPDDIYYGDIKGVRGEKMVPILVGAIKELTRRLEILENA